MGDRMITQPLVVIDPKSVSTVSTQRGDILVVKLPSGLLEPDNPHLRNVTGQLGAILCQLGLGNTPMLFVDRRMDIESLDEESMEKLGWVRKEPQ